MNTFTDLLHSNSVQHVYPVYNYTIRCQFNHITLVIDYTLNLLIFCIYTTVLITCAVVLTRADQSTGGALLEFPMKTAMHGKSRVSSAISVCDH